MSDTIVGTEIKNANDLAGLGFAAGLKHWAQLRPDEVFAVFDTGEEWTFAQLRELVMDTARVLQDAGVGRDDRVVVWLESGPLPIRTWLAVSYLGAVLVPINTAYRGGLLEHALDLAEARVIVTHADLVDRLASVAQGRPKLVYAVNPAAAPAVPGLEVRDAADLLASRAADPTPGEEHRPWDTQMVLYTSGTTGPSKAVLCSYRHIAAMATGGALQREQSDRVLVHSPLFHVTGICGVLWALGCGASIAVLSRFRTSTFWKDVLALRATYLVMMGSLARFLLNQPITPEEEQTTLRMALVAPLNADSVAFAKRVGIDYYSVFNMTEVSTPLVTVMNPDALASCGVPRPGVQVRLVDENDIEMPIGQVGELIVRTDDPWMLSSGYYRNEAATASSLRNGWFHTGDGMRRDEEGNFYYVDRMKDSIRRRGENISSFEVEVEVQAHPAVAEAAAVAVPSEVGEDDVMVFVTLNERAELDPAELIEFLRGRMAHFMVPRYLRVIDELPRTPTLKVQKARLRGLGLDQAWDREAAGIRIKRDVIG